MSTLKGVFPMLYLLALWAAGLGAASAQNSIEAVDVTQQGGAVVVRVTTREPLQSVPPNFTVANPARIAFDFTRTVNALGRNSQEIGQGELRSMNVIQAADKSRLVLNLRRPVVHEARVDGRNLIITLQQAAASVAPSDKVAHFAEGRADARHAIRDVDFRRGSDSSGRVIVDRVLRYERLEDELAGLGVPISLPLPRAKGGVRQQAQLTDAQRARVAAIFAAEIALHV